MTDPIDALNAGMPPAVALIRMSVPGYLTGRPLLTLVVHCGGLDRLMIDHRIVYAMTGSMSEADRDAYYGDGTDAEVQVRLP